MDNQGSVVLRGRIGSDLSSMSAQNGTKGLRFRMAAPQWRITDAGQYEEREPKWYTVCVWDRLAQNIARSVQKGTPVIVCGRPSARGWLGPDQQVRSELVINASFMGIDLVFGPAVALKPQHPSMSPSLQLLQQKSLRRMPENQSRFLLKANIFWYKTMI